MQAGRRWLGRVHTVALVAVTVALLAGCGGPPNDATLVLQVGPPDDATTVATAADIVRARLAALGVDGVVTVDGSHLRLAVPPAQPGSTLVASLTDPGRLRLVGVPTSEVVTGGDALDPSWETVVEATAAIPAVVDVDQVGNPAITFTFAGADAERIADYTTAHIGESLALAIGDEVLAVPVIQAPITNGQMQLVFANDQGWTSERLRELAARVSIGPLPAPLREVPGG